MTHSFRAWLTSRCAEWRDDFSNFFSLLKKKKFQKFRGHRKSCNIRFGGKCQTVFGWVMRLISGISILILLQCCKDTTRHRHVSCSFLVDERPKLPIIYSQVNIRCRAHAGSNAANGVNNDIGSYIVISVTFFNSLDSFNRRQFHFQSENVPFYLTGFWRRWRQRRFVCPGFDVSIRMLF